MSLNMFKHIIMTRFNLATPGKEFAIRTQAGWLENRFDLFERFCLPSVAAQRNKDFDWIIYFDSNTPDTFKQRVARLQNNFPFRAYYTPLFLTEGWNRSLRETYDLNAPLLLSTRLDNDDALPVDFTERLHTFVAQNAFALGAYNFRHGLIRKREALYRMAHPKNAFFSRLESVGGTLRPAPAIQHMRLECHGPIFQIEGAPGWLQIVHDTNVSNKVRGIRVAHESYLELFPPAILEGIEKPKRLRLIIENYGITALWSLRDTIFESFRQAMRTNRK